MRILVKAFPQPSAKYEETVCCAGVIEETQEFVRLFPIRFRRLPEDCRFDRYDLVEMIVTKANDGRPESYRVDEDSISVIERATPSNFPDELRVKLWPPFIYPNMEALTAAQKENGTSLGIVCPDNVTFHHAPFEQAEQDVKDMLQKQQFLFEKPLKPLKPPKYRFYYRFTTGEKEHMRTIMDWEVQAAYYNFKRRYGSEAKTLTMLEDQYAKRIPKQNLHFVMGTMAKRKFQFILIGLLRSPLSPEDVTRQHDLF